jgi:hypothetical protein
MKENLKIGVILSSEEVSLWIYRVIDQVMNSELAEINLILFHQEATRSNNSIKSLIYRLHKKADRWLLHKRIDYDKIVDTAQLLHGIAKISVSAASSGSELDEVLQEVTRQNLDIILNFSSFTIPDSDIQLARYGIWHYGIAGRNKPGDMADGYWELVNKEPAIETVLRCSNSFQSGKAVIYRSWFPTHFNSIAINTDHAYGLSSLIIPRLIKGLYHHGLDYFNNLPSESVSMNKESGDRIAFPPSNIRAFRNMLVILLRFLIYRLEYTEKWKWFLMYTFSRDLFPNLSRHYNVLKPPKDRFWADPFVICRNGEIYIFIEEVLYKTMKGHITLLVINEKGQLLRTRKILDKPYHMSYPFVFNADGNYYMIPETSENKSIDLYKCEEFPVKWSFAMNLMDNIIAKDTTLFFHDNKWWLFTAINESQLYSEYAELFLFYSSDLFTSKWIPHPNNPISTDIRTARPAGKVFVHQDKIYRPSQDCSGRYGRAININQIITLSETSYKEVLVSRTDATWEKKLKGTHTFNSDENFSIIDVYKY